MSQNFKFFENYFVGINHARKDTTAGPLAFMTPNEDSPAGRKRQASVRQWLNGSCYSSSDTAEKETKIITNDAQRGFRIVNFASRHTTSAKVARVYDPNGFEVEISVPYLVELMLASTIERGEIQAECVWLRNGAVNWLTRADDARVADARSVRSETSCKASKTNKLNHVPGDIIRNTYGDYFYIGHFHVQVVVATGEIVEDVEYTKQRLCEIENRKRIGYNLGIQFFPRFFKEKTSAAGVDYGKFHVYYDQSLGGLSAEAGRVTLRKKKMAAHSIVDQAVDAIPTVDQQSYFELDYPFLYDTDGKVIGYRFENSEHGVKTIHRDSWETNTLRLSSVPFDQPVDIKQIPSHLVW